MWTLGGTGGFKVSDGDGEEVASGKTSVQGAHGLHVAAYLVPTSGFHIGAFVHRIEGQALLEPKDGEKDLANFNNVNFGIAMKAGGEARRSFVSFALDVGLASLMHSSPVQRGLWLHPRLQVDIMAVRDTPMKAAVFLGLGPACMVVVGPEDPENENKGLHWTITPTFQLGGSFGG